MSQPEQAQDSQDNNVTEFVLIQLSDSNNEASSIQKAIGIYKNEHDAYAAAVIHQMQSIEQDNSNKSLDDTQQEQINELCRYMKEELTNYKDRFDHMTSKSPAIFQHTPRYQISSIENKNSIPQEINESIFKTKVRNFLDAFQSKSDTEEDLGNSDDDEDDDEEELLEGEDEDEGEDDLEEAEDDEAEGGEEENEDEDIEHEENVEEEELEDDEEAPHSDTTVQETEDSSEEEEELLEDDSSSNNLKRNASIMEEEEEEDEIDEDNEDEDELEDDEDTSSSAKKRRVPSSKD